MNDTPLTDKEAFFQEWDRRRYDPSGPCCDSAFARQLERENAALVKEREDYKTWYTNTHDHYDNLRATLAERDREIEHWKTFWASKSDAIRREVDYLPPASMVRQFVIYILENNAE